MTAAKRIPHVLTPVILLLSSSGLGAADGLLTVMTAPESISTSRHSTTDPFRIAFERASAAQRAKDFDLALQLFREASTLADRRSRPMSWLTTQFNICHTLNLMGNRKQAAAVAEQIVADCEASYGSGDPLTSEALAHLAYVLKQHGRLADAEPVYRRNVALLEEKYGCDHYLVANAICQHGSLLQSMGKLEKAEAQLRRALAIALDATNASGDPADLCLFLTHLGYCLHEANQPGEARELMDMAYDIIQQNGEAVIPSAGSILRRQAEYYRDIHDLARAEDLAYRGLLRLARRHDVNRAKFFYHETVAEIYRTVLRAKGMNESQIASAIDLVEKQAAILHTAATNGTDATRTE
jgi:tetratricopeptide (TPR) repeat protein